jgi:hypothetical protein
MRAAASLVAALGLFACGGATVAAVEIALTSSGASPADASAPSSGAVHFINRDTVDHQIASTDCPNLSSPRLAPGADFTGPLPAGPKVCSWSDSLNPADTKFKGQITVAAPGSGGGGGGGGSGY